MDKSKFRGWKDVFSFTFHQAVKRKGYIATTAGFAVLVLAAVILAVVITAKPEEGKVEFSSIHNAYVVSEYNINYNEIFAALEREEFSKVNFHTANDVKDAVSQAKTHNFTDYVVVTIHYKNDTFSMEAVLPEETTISRSDAQDLLNAMAECSTYAKVEIAGLTQEQAIAVMTPVISDYAKIGEDKSFGVVMVKTLAPMIFGLVLYMMLIFYGQDVSREISAEKTSKLTETLLTSVKPYALITGKVLAVALTAIIQFFMWILCAAAGLVIGNIIAQSMYPGYQNVIIQLLGYMRDTFSSSAFSPVAVVLAVFIFITGFLLYCVLAGIAGSMVSKPEDTAQVQGIFQFPVIISFFACYFGVLLEKEGLITVTRFIPFTIPFGMPVDLLTGAASLLQGVISLLILIVFCVLFILLSGRLYEGLILYNGQKLTPKTMLNVIRVKKN